MLHTLNVKGSVAAAMDMGRSFVRFSCSKRYRLPPKHHRATAGVEGGVGGRVGTGEGMLCAAFAVEGPDGLAQPYEVALHDGNVAASRRVRRGERAGERVGVRVGLRLGSLLGGLGGGLGGDGSARLGDARLGFPHRVVVADALLGILRDAVQIADTHPPLVHGANPPVLVPENPDDGVLASRRGKQQMAVWTVSPAARRGGHHGRAGPRQLGSRVDAIVHDAALVPVVGAPRVQRDCSEGGVGHGDVGKGRGVGAGRVVGLVPSVDTDPGGVDGDRHPADADAQEALGAVPASVARWMGTCGPPRRGS